MFGKKTWQEGDHVFTSVQDGEYRNIIVGVITGVEDSKIGVNGIIKNPNPKDCILALIYRVEHDNYTGVFDVNTAPILKIHKRIHNVIDGWVRESIPELINNVLSLPDGTEKDQAKRILKQRMDTLYDQELKKYMYSICRSLKILN